MSKRERNCVFRGKMWPLAIRRWSLERQIGWLVIDMQPCIYRTHRQFWPSYIWDRSITTKFETPLRKLFLFDPFFIDKTFQQTLSLIGSALCAIYHVYMRAKGQKRDYIDIICVCPLADHKAIAVWCYAQAGNLHNTIWKCYSSVFQFRFSVASPHSNTRK